MIRTDEENLICDFAETYGVLDYKELPPAQAAVLFFGLSENSRTKRKLSGQKLTLEQSLLALLADGVNMIAWILSKGGERPKSVYQTLSEVGEPEEHDTETQSFATEEELMQYLDSFEEKEVNK